MSILVFGDIMLDKYIDGNVNRISPEAPVPIVHVEKQYSVLGGCGNVSNGLAALQVPQTLICYCGNDENGKEIRRQLAEKKIPYNIINNQLPTITKVRVVSNKHQLLRYDTETVAPLTKKSITETIKQIETSKATYAVISDYGKGATEESICQYIIKKYKTLVDPKTSDWVKYKSAYLVSPNFKELCEALGNIIANENAAIEKAAKQLMKVYNIENILVTRSAKGMSLITKTNALHIATEAKDVYDVTGAGDTVIATVAAMLYKGKSLMDAVKIANKAAAIAVAHFGTYAVTKKDLGIK